MRIKRLWQAYPRQFWLLFVGMLISTTGASMIWPFLMIYVSERLDQPLAQVAALYTVNSIAGLAAAFLGGPLTDRVGRKGVMVVGLGAHALTYLFLSRADTWLMFAALMAVTGAMTPLYRIGADAMLADLIPQERRIEAFSWLRMSNNLGIALGPILGGLAAARSYTVAFYIAAGCMGFYSLLIAFRARETLPPHRPAANQPGVGREPLGGYGSILRDRTFVSFWVAFAFNQVGASMVWLLLSVYAKRNFGISEAQYGPIATTNALMVVFFQLAVTRFVKRFPPWWTMAAGALFYAVSVTGIASATGFWGMWVCMVVMTVGELIITPTASTLVANLAPPDKRGRYMSLYGLTWNAAAGVGPVMGGVLSDRFGPSSTWYGGGLAGLVSTLLFAGLAVRKKHVSDKATPEITSS